MASRAHPRFPSRPPPPAATLDSAAIDATYGLEPVFDPAKARGTGGGVSEFVAAGCPYCGEPIDVVVDVLAGASHYVEDCSVCCHPIEMTVRTTPSGRFAGLTVARIDG